MTPATSARRRGSGWYVIAACLAWIVLIAALNVPPVALDALLQTRAGQWPFLLRLPLSVLLLTLTLGPWLPARRALAGWLWSPPVWSIVLILTVVCCRWSVFTSFEATADESESINAARILLQDSRFWQSVDVGTHGPLVSLWQTVLPRLGLAIDYAGSRLLGAVMMSVCALAVYSMLRRIASEPAARLLAAPLAFVLAGFGLGEWVQYNGDHPVVLLMLLSAAAATRALFPPGDAPAHGAASEPANKAERTYLLLAGSCAGAIAWAKLQGAPQALALIAATAVGCWLAPTPVRDARTRWRRLLWYGIGLALPSLVIGIWALLSGSFVPMARSYFEWNWVYARRIKSARDLAFARDMAVWGLRNFVGMNRMQALTQPAVLAGWCLLLVQLWRTRRRNDTPTRAGQWIALLAVLLTGAGWASALVPGNQYLHYLLLPLFPVWLGGLVGWAWVIATPTNPAATSETAPGASGLPRVALAYAIIALLLPWAVWGFAHGPQGGGGALTVPFTYWASRNSATHQVVARVTRPGDRIAVWGWMPELYITTGRLPATRTAACLREAVRGQPMQDYFYGMYLTDWDRNRPAVFVDEVRVTPSAPGADRGHSGLKVVYDSLRERDPSLPAHPEQDFLHEQYPELARRVRENYHLLETTPEGIRIYLRNDRRR